jgi:hypothetical protein
MRSGKKRKQSDWQFAMEQIGREFRNSYPPLEKLSPQLRALITRLERKTRVRRKRQQRNEGDD